MADRVHSVFVSSTYEDLRQERLAITDLLLRSSCLPAGMELFSASARPPWQTITRSLDLADYMVLILAGRYGSILKDTKKSYTENEYEYALEHGIPVLAFLHGDLDLLSHGKVEVPKLRQVKAFHRRVTNGEHTVDFWRSSDELQAKVAVAIPAAVRDFPRAGWVRGDVSMTGRATFERPVIDVAVERVDSIPLCALRSNSEAFDSIVEDQSKEALQKLPPEPERRTGGRSAGSVLGQGIYDMLRESDAMTRAVMAPETRTRQQYAAEVAKYGKDLRQGLEEARRKLAARHLAPLRLGVRNRKAANLFDAQLRLVLDGDIDVVLPSDVEPDWTPVDSLPDAPREWGPTPRLGTSLPGWPRPDLTDLYERVEVERADGHTVLTFPAVNVRPSNFEKLDPVVLIVSDSDQRIRRAQWTLTATNVDDVTEGEFEIDFAGAPRDVWREWSATQIDGSD